ncbi:choice-of-anchor Q domain-containing protein [Lysobacter sp. F6437]|uniref:choice-of-anchor Q domain-containing protein n=1 Tax=Lysobacter sp. F6437 TaxID=3459296 RepID=UPI00403D88E9
MSPDLCFLHRLARPPGWIMLLLLLGLSMQPAVAAQTYYVRTDGGSARQCTGLADAPYPGNGSGQACAWNSPLVALPTDDATRIDGGDTLVIGPGDYMIGWGAPGLEESRRCYTEARYDCYPAAVPSGTGPTTRTRILGKGHDSGCTAPPRLWGTERVDQVLNLEGSNHVEVGCLEITDRSDCIEFHTDDRVRCERDDAPYGDWASIGIWARDSRDAWLHDLDIHGLSGRGIMAGGLRDWTIERVRINANGWAGWDGDIGDGSSNAGDMVFRDVEIAWNGCTERWKTGEVHACWAQEAGGYGDGLGTAETGGRWLFEDTRVHHNTSDGIDLLYLDEAATTSSTFRRVRAVANAGNQIKTIGTAWIENSVIVGSCAYFYKKFDMTWSDQCRAMGNAVSIGATNGQVTTLVHNTITGEGDCLVLTSGGDQTARVDIQNNVFVGAVDFLADADGNPGELTCGHYADESRATVRFSGNAFWNVKGGQCPPGGNLCGKDPRLAGMALDDFEPMPLPGSPLIDRATPRDGVGADFLGQPRLEGPATDIGAVEFRGDAPTVSAAKAATTDGTARRPPRNRNGHAAAGFWDRLYDGAAFGCNAIRIAGQSLAGAGCLVSIHMARRSLGWILDRR